MSHQYRTVQVGAGSLRLHCSCGWKSSTVSRSEGSSSIYAQWQGHRKASSS